MSTHSEASRRPKKIRRTTPASCPSPLANDFIRTASWSPEGTHILTENEDRSVRLFQVPDAVEELHDAWEPILSLPSPDATACTAWYPGARSEDPASMCFMKATKDHPIHLVDAGTGKVRASYPIVDHLERFVAPHSMVFSYDASSVYCGHDSALEVLSLDRPGCSGERYRTSSSRKSKDGQKGIISTLAVDPSKSGILAAGSFSGSIALYDTFKSSIEPVSVLPRDPYSPASAGVSQVQYHPSRPIIFSTCRKSDHITCWDLRQTATALQTFHRPGLTNQRLSFDIDPWGRWLTTGGQDGCVRFYDVQTFDSSPIALYGLHDDAVPVASIHPWKALLLTCAGSRHFDLPGTRRHRRPPTPSRWKSDSESDDSLDEAYALPPRPVRAEPTMALWQLPQPDS